MEIRVIMGMKRLSLAASAVLWIAACGSEREAALNVDRDSALVDRVELRDELTKTGEVRPLSKVDLRTEASGTISKVLVKEGQSLRRLDTILIIDDAPMRLKEERLKLSVRKADIQKDKAKRALDRSRLLVSLGALAARTAIDAENDWQLADLIFRQEALELREIQDQIRKTVVRSPMAGVLTELRVREGEIAASAVSNLQNGTDIGVVADIGRLEIVTDVGEADFPRLSEGMGVKIRMEASANLSTTGRVSFVSMTARKKKEQGLGTFEVRIAVDSLVAGLVPGVSVHVDFLLLKEKDVLAIPCEYLETKGGETLVNRVNVGEAGKITVEKIAIKVGRTDFKNIEVLSGLAKGEKVLLPSKAGASSAKAVL